MTAKKIAIGQYQVGRLRVENWSYSGKRCWVVLEQDSDQPVASHDSKQDAVRLAYRHLERQP